MFSWLAKAMLNRNMARLREGDYAAVLKIDAKDIRFRFPGDSSWAAENRQPRRPWTLAAALRGDGPKVDADEIIAQGPPWNMTLCVRGISYLDTEDGRAYENRYVMWGRMSWGLLREYEVYRTLRRPRRSMSTYRSARAPRSPQPRQHRGPACNWDCGSTRRSCHPPALDPGERSASRRRRDEQPAGVRG